MNFSRLLHRVRLLALCVCVCVCVCVHFFLLAVLAAPVSLLLSNPVARSLHHAALLYMYTHTYTQTPSPLSLSHTHTHTHSHSHTHTPHTSPAIAVHSSSIIS